jgi:parallel beta-helix repeat protein
VYNNESAGIYADGAGIRIEGMEVYGNYIGIKISNQDGSSASEVRGNRVHDNRTSGIAADGQVLVAGNTVSGHTATSSQEMYLGGGARAVGNVVFGNVDGLEVWGGTVEGNRIYGNAAAGIVVPYDSTTLRGNTVYSNHTGILVAPGTWAAAEVVNNLLYANTDQGLRLTAGTGHQVRNNTIYQAVGGAVELQGGVRDVQLTNNILWVDSGPAINVANDSQVGFQSDYNLFYTQGTGVVARWQDTDRATLSAWRSAAFTDTESLFADPLFVDRDGVDGVLRYGGPAQDGRDDDFHEQSRYGSFHGGSLSPVLSATTGLPVFPTAVETLDEAQSLAIDRGDAASSFANEPGPNGGYVNIGAYGNTGQASRSPSQYVFLTHPNGGESVAQKKTYPIAWRSSGVPGNVTIEYSTTGLAGPFTVLAANEANDGSYNWYVDPAVFPLSDQYAIRISSVDIPSVADASDFLFSVTQPISFYYVNDNSLTGDEYTTAIGSDSNDGLTPATPKASIKAVVEAYDLEPGDVVYVDTGTYPVTTNLVLGEQDSGVRIQGPVGAGHRAVLDRGNRASGAYIVELSGADDVTLTHLTLTGASMGIFGGDYVHSDRFTLAASELSGHALGAVELRAGNEGARLVNNTVHDNAGYGLLLYGAQTQVHGGVVYNNGSDGIYASGAGTRIEGVEVYGNGNTGIGIWNAAGSSVSVVRDNRVHDNRYSGIEAGGQVLVVDNTVSGHTATSSPGIRLWNGARAVDNAVFGNFNGIAVVGGTVEGNRIYGNTAAGIVVYDRATLRGNTVYSNHTGITVAPYYLATAEVVNNLLYANTDQGLRLAGGTGHQVHNNTLYQPVGTAVGVQGGASHVHLSNNILWVDLGTVVNIAADSMTGFTSDYNLFYLGSSAAAQVGSWGGTALDSLESWTSSTSQDTNSHVSNPEFLDINGADNVFGGLGTAEGSGADDNFGLRKNSPAIDAANAYVASRHDIVGNQRHDDPSTLNTGTGWALYVEQDTAGNQFAETGAAQNWYAANSYWELTLPFAFPFYGTGYTRCRYPPTASSSSPDRMPRTVIPTLSKNSSAILALPRCGTISAPMEHWTMTFTWIPRWPVRRRSAGQGSTRQVAGRSTSRSPCLRTGHSALTTAPETRVSRPLWEFPLAMAIASCSPDTADALPWLRQTRSPGVPSQA